MELLLSINNRVSGDISSTGIERSSNAPELYAMCNIWIVVILLGALCNMISFHIVYPIEVVATDMFPTSHGEIGYVLLPILVIFNITTGIPTVIVRISSYFVEKRITKLIEYLETIQNENHDIVAVMSWYDGKNPVYMYI